MLRVTSTSISYSRSKRNREQKYSNTPPHTLDATITITSNSLANYSPTGSPTRVKDPHGPYPFSILVSFVGRIFFAAKDQKL